MYIAINTELISEFTNLYNTHPYDDTIHPDPAIVKEKVKRVVVNKRSQMRIF